jgi:hypothetical protein
MMNFKILLLTMLVFLSGCVRYIITEPAPNSYYLNSIKKLKGVGRVGLIEFANNSSIHQISTGATEAIFQEIQKRQMFGLTKVWRDDPAWRSLQVDVNMNYTFEELSQMRKSLKCDALLIGTITGFEPYPHMSMGLRLQLIDLYDGQLIWALEQVWDTTDKTVQNRIESYYNPRRFMFEEKNLSGQLGSVSSLKFFKFVAYEIAQTLEENL